MVSHEGYDDFTQEIMVPPEPGEATRVSARLRAGLARGPAADIEEPRPPTRTPPAAAPVRPPAPPARETPPETPPVAVQPPETPPLPPATRAEPPTLERERRASEGIGRGWFYSGLTATALFATTAIITGGVALSESNEYNDPKTSPARRQVLLDRGPTLAHTTDAFLALTALAAGTTVWLYFKTDWRVTPTPSGVSVAGRF